jgi:hypothetical protein
LDDIGATLLLRSVAFVSTATDEIEALAKIEHFFRGDAGDVRGIQPHCSWRPLSQRRHRGDFFRCSLVDDLRAPVKSDTKWRGSAGSYRGEGAGASDRGYNGSIALTIL